MSVDVYCPKNVPGYDYEPEEIARNVVNAHKRELPYPSLEGVAREGVVHVIGGGPTNKEFFENLDGVTGNVVFTGSTCQILIQKPDIFEALKRVGLNIVVVINAHSDWAETLDKPLDGVEYWVASLGHPNTFDALDGGDVRVFDVYVPELGDAYYETPVIGGGSTAPSAALPLLIQLGFKDFKLWGVDGGGFTFSGYDMDEILKDVPPEYFEEVTPVQVGGEIIEVPRNFANQLEELMNFIPNYAADCKFKFAGNSVNSKVFNLGMDAQILHDPRVDPELDAPEPLI